MQTIRTAFVPAMVAASRNIAILPAASMGQASLRKVEDACHWIPRKAAPSGLPQPSFRGRVAESGNHP
ncbi:hypothetical protein GCM10008965_40880 [Methylorubrum aminovorans]